jgi:hypothetical protein
MTWVKPVWFITAKKMLLDDVFSDTHLARVPSNMLPVSKPLFGETQARDTYSSHCTQHGARDRIRDVGFTARCPGKLGQDTSDTYGPRGDHRRPRTVTWCIAALRLLETVESSSGKRVCCCSKYATSKHLLPPGPVQHSSTRQ